MKEALDHLVEKLDGLAPTAALVLGSGLGRLVDQVEDARRISYSELPGFPRSGVSGHAGEVVAGHFAGTPVLMLSGRAHYYEHGNAAAMRPALEVLAGIGISHLILTNAAGSVEPDMGPGSVMLITDHINFSGFNPLIGEPSDRRFVGLSEAYDAGLRMAIEKAAKETGTALHKGVYMWFSGPCFETPAEIRMARIVGANAVGMSTVPEVIVGVHSGLRNLGLSIVTDMCLPDALEPAKLEEIIAVANAAEKRLRVLVRRVVAELP